MNLSRSRLGLLTPLIAAALLTGSAVSAATTTTAPTTTIPSVTTTTPPPCSQSNPFTNATIVSYLKSQTSNVTAGLYNPTSGCTYLYRPGVHEVTASMIKIDILGTLLAEAQAAHRHLSAAEQAQATVMIEDSDNAAAQELWNDIGGFGLSSQTSGTGGYYAIQNFNKRIGFTQTQTNWAWGLMSTTPTDFLRLLRAIWGPGHVLNPASQAYEQGLMERVTPAQRFGIPNGVPRTAVVGNKNGWYPEASGWQINSAGYVHRGSVTYLAVVMTAQNPDEGYGMATVNTVGSLLWRYESRSH